MERQDIGINYQLYEFISTDKSLNEDLKCPHHSNQILKFYCKLEKSPLCQICLANGHLGVNHQIIALKETIFCEKIRKKNLEIINSSKQAIIKSKETTMELEENLSEFNNKMKTMKENLLNKINLQYTNALNQISDDNMKEMNCYEKKIKQMQTMEIETNAYLKELDNLNEKQDSILLLEISKKYDCFDQKLELPQLKNRKSSELKIDAPFPIPLLSKDQKNLYLLAQNSNYDSKNQKMLRRLSEKGIVKNEQILSALIHINRKNFVKPDDKSIVFDDIYKPIKFSHNYTIPSPVVTAKLLEEVKPMDKIAPKILEIGSGTGYISACLAYLIGNKGKILSIENNEVLLDTAKKNIKEFNPEVSDIIEFELKDYKALNFNPESFDIIVISMVFQSFPIEFEEMLARNGVMWVSIGSIYSKNVSNYIFEKDNKGEVRSRKVEIPEPSILNYF